jgi:beta-glucosidase
VKTTFTIALLLLCAVAVGILPAHGESATNPQTQSRKEIYHDGWIDLNKNGRMDLYENPKAPIDQRVNDLLSQMNVDEKTCQTATLYGVGRGRTGQKAPMEDELPTPEWKPTNFGKDSIASIEGT